MRVLTLLHRWWGVAFCLLFAMWFASGIAMHFVPFPSSSEADRFAALLPIDPDRVGHGPAEAVAASGIAEVLRVRLVGRSDGPIYLISGPSAFRTLRASDLADGAVNSTRTALDIASDYARARELDTARAHAGEPIAFDQWSVSGEFDSDRPLYRSALNDDAGTELYVASTTGDVVLVTTRGVRAVNYIGSIAHWIYPTSLRHHLQAWTSMMWWLSLLAWIGAGFGVVIGLAQLTVGNRGATLPYRGLQAWHYRFGLVCAPFVLGFAFSGWLSMDDGRWLKGHDARADARAITSTADWSKLSPGDRSSAGVKEIEWFAFGGNIYRRERASPEQQQLYETSPNIALLDGGLLRAGEIDHAIGHLATGCAPASIIATGDDGAVKSRMPNAPVFRAVCGDSWFEIDGASGALLDRLDAPQRAYRRIFESLHTLRFWPLTSHPLLRTILIVALCGCGFAFSLTGVVIGMRRLLISLRPFSRSKTRVP
jgi:PepSY-associated TM region